MRWLFLFFPFLVFSQNITLSDADIKAFPSAQGFGRITTGGRGGQIVHVTNLNNSGPGSLRAACEMSGPRVIVFDVAGNIELIGESSIEIGSTNFDLNVARENITIAGETAPFPGITITGGGLEIYTSNVIVRYITIRTDIATVEANDALRIRNWGVNGYNQSNVIIDHVSLSHGSDENLSIGSSPTSRTIQDVTVQFCLLGETQENKQHLRGQYVYNYSMLNNFWTEATSRNPLIGYGTNSETMEFINNIIYGSNSGPGISRGNIVDILANIAESNPTYPFDFDVFSLGSQGYNNPIGTGSVFVDGNFIVGPKKAGVSDYNTELLTYNGASRVINNSLVSTWETTYQGIIDLVLPSVGNSIYRDALDEGWINNFYNKEGVRAFTAVPSKTPGSHPVNYDSDGDGLSDEYEVANGAGPGNWFVSPSTRPVTAQLVSGATINQTGVTAGIRYTHMDIFLGELAGDWTGGSSGGGGTNDPATDKGRSGTSAMLIAH